MRTILTIALAAGVALATATAAEYVSSSASGTTSAAVNFPMKDGKAFRLLTVDVTSDKAASVISWVRPDGTSSSMARSAADNTTNLVVWDSTLASNDVVLLENASGTITERTVWGRTGYTNQELEFRYRISTNLAVGDALYELTNTATTVYTNAAIDTNATDLHVTATNGFAPNDVIIVRSVTNGWTAITTVSDVGATNLTIGGVGFALYGGDIVTRMISHGSAQAVVSGSAYKVTVEQTGTNYLAAGDSVIIAPATGGIFTNVYVGAAPRMRNQVMLTATTGVALSVGDGVYKTTTYTTPVGNATLRLNGAAVFVSPGNRPGRLKVDGTSACAINNAVGIYE